MDLSYGSILLFINYMTPGKPSDVQLSYLCNKRGQELQ